MYIFADLPEIYTVPKGYYETATTLGGGTVKAFCSEDEALSDFYVIYCYANGKEGFFRLDMLESTIQRAPEFSLTATDNAKPNGGKFDPIDTFKNFSLTEKIMCCSLAAALIIIIILIIALIVKSRKLKKTRYNDPISDEDMENFFNIASGMPAARHEAEDNE
jgi:hypothetical protein